MPKKLYSLNQNSFSVLGSCQFVCFLTDSSGDNVIQSTIHKHFSIHFFFCPFAISMLHLIEQSSFIILFIIHLFPSFFCPSLKKKPLQTALCLGDYNTSTSHDNYTGLGNTSIFLVANPMPNPFRKSCLN